MFKLIGDTIFLVTLCCVLGFWTQVVVDAKPAVDKLIEGYDEINDYIVDHDPQGTAESNVNVANKLMRSPTFKLTSSFKKQPSKESLAEFTALKNLDDVHQCNGEGHAILLTNDEATGHRAHVPSSALKSRTLRVDKVVHHYALKHAKSCQQIYPQNFDKIYRQGLDPEKAKRVERYLNELISSKLFLEDPSLPSFSNQPDEFFTPENREFFIENVMHINTVTGFGDAQVALHAIESSDSKLRQLMSRRLDKVNSLVRAHLVEPCQHYIDKLGPDVFVPAEYDLEVLEEGERFQPFSESLSKFYQGWAHFRLCKILIQEQRDLTRQMMGMANQGSKF